MKKTIFAVFAVISLLSLSVFAQSIAITNARIVTVSGAEIPKGTVVIRDGLIESVGPSAKIPADAKIFDGNGLSVYPGLIDTYTNAGLPQTPQTQTPGRGGGGGQTQTQTAPASNSNYAVWLQPEDSAFEKLTGKEAEFETARNNGFTTVLTVSPDGIFNGQSTIINLAGESVSSMVLVPKYAQHITFRTGQGGYPTSLMGTFSSIRQMFLDAQRLIEWKKMYAANPRGIKRPEADRSLESLIPLLDRDMPTAFNANSENEIIRALDFAREFNLKPVIVGGNEAYKVLDRLKKANATVLLSLNFPKKTAADSPEADPEPIEVLRLRVEAPKNAARLAQAGVKFAFQSGGMKNPGDFLANAGKAISSGLSAENALKAMTLGSAEVLGLSDRLGSIEAGKIANLIVTKGDIFAKDKTITHVFVDGKYFEQKPPTQRPTGRSGTGGSNPAAAGVAQVGGIWNVIVDVPGQSVQVAITFRQQGAALTGTISSQMFGSSEIRNGQATADGFRFDSTVNVGQSIDVSFSGKVSGNQVTGTSTTPQGAVPFSGSRNPQD